MLCVFIKVRRMVDFWSGYFSSGLDALRSQLFSSASSRFLVWNLSFSLSLLPGRSCASFKSTRLRAVLSCGFSSYTVFCCNKLVLGGKTHTRVKTKRQAALSYICPRLSQLRRVSSAIPHVKTTGLTLEPVLRLMPNCSHRSVTVKRLVCASVTNRINLFHWGYILPRHCALMCNPSLRSVCYLSRRFVP